jgi:hypothetical protein
MWLLYTDTVTLPLCHFITLSLDFPSKFCIEMKLVYDEQYVCYITAEQKNGNDEIIWIETPVAQERGGIAPLILDLGTRWR